MNQKPLESLYVTFKLQYDPNLIGNFYITLKTQIPNLDDQIIMQNMQFDNKSNIYKTTIEVQPKVKYQYQYSIKMDDQNIKENGFRGYEYSKDDPMEVDQWNKQWCKYTFNYCAYNPRIFDGYLVVIRDQKQNNDIELVREASNYKMSSKEIINLDQEIKYKQLYFYQKNLDGKKLLLYEQQQAININKDAKFNSNLICVEYNKLDIEAKQRMENYSLLLYQAQILKQQVQELNQQESIKQNRLKEIDYQHQMDLIRQNQIHQQTIFDLESIFKNELEKIIRQSQQQLEQQKINMEKEFDDFKNYSEKTIQKYIDQNEQAHKKIMELEFSKINFSSDEIKIQVEDFDQLSKDEQDNLQKLQDKLNIYESTIKIMKEEKKGEEENLDNQKYRLKKCRESNKELQKQVEQLQKQENDSRLENQQEKDIFKQKYSKYKQKLKEINEKLQIKDKELHNAMEALKELERKYQEEQQKNIQQKEEFEISTQQLQQKQKQKLNELLAQNKLNFEQYEKHYEQKIKSVNEQRKKDLSRIIDIEAKQKSEEIRKQINLKNQLYNFKSIFSTQKSIQDSYKQFKYIMSDISNFLLQLQEDIINNYKELGVQIIQELQKKYINDGALEDLIDENFYKLVCQLIVLLNQCCTDKNSINQDSQDISHIWNLEQLNNQLQKNVTIIMKKQYYKNICSDKTKKAFKLLFILMVMILSILYFLCSNEKQQIIEIFYLK